MSDFKNRREGVWMVAAPFVVALIVMGVGVLMLLASCASTKLVCTTHTVDQLTSTTTCREVPDRD